MSVTANRLILNKRCEFWFDGENVSVPLAACSASALPAVLDQVGGGELSVQFHTTNKPEDVAADLKKFGKRLAGIGPQWNRGEWAPRTVDAVVYVCTLSRR